MPGIWDLIKLEDQPYVRTLPDLFEHGLERGPDALCLGHRPIISTNPLKVRVSIAALRLFALISISQTCFLHICSLRTTTSGRHTDKSMSGGGTLGVLCASCTSTVLLGVERCQQLGPGVRTGQVRLLIRSLTTQLYSTLTIIAEWQVIDWSLHAYGFVGVSLYDTLGKDSVGACHSHLCLRSRG